MIHHHGRRTRSPLVAGLLAASLVLAGCGSDESAPTASEDTRSIEHARGTADVPAQPQRVVVLEPVQLDTAIALGITPVGAAVPTTADNLPDYLGEDAKSITAVGTVTTPELEKIAALDPDLIIGTDSRHGDLYDQLAEVAPTVFMATQSDPWQENSVLIADALGKKPEGEQLLADYNDRCAEIAESYDTEGMTAQLIRPREDVLTVYGPISFAGSTLECAGFTIPERDWQEEISIDLSPELISEVDADLVLVTSQDPADPATMPESIAIHADQWPVLELVDFSYWIAGVGPLGGLTVLDDLERIIEDM
nr:iron-siderophore ABC transporter substrate-binding protein [Lolliginicoccus suaedae]